MTTSGPLSMKRLADWAFDPVTGAETHPCAFIHSRILDDLIQNVLPAFSRSALMGRCCDFLGERTMNVASLSATCIDMREQEQRIWLVFLPSGKKTIMVIIRFLEESEKAFQELTEALSKACLTIHDVEFCVVQKMIDFQLSHPLAIAKRTEDQIFISRLGAYPTTEPGAPLGVITAIPVSLFRQQFAPFIKQRLNSMSLDVDQASVTPLSSYGFSVRTRSIASPDIVFHSRYLFLPKYVICVEITSLEASYFELASQFTEFLESIFVIKPEP